MGLGNGSSKPSLRSSTSALTVPDSSSAIPICAYTPLTVVGAWDFEEDGWNPPVRELLFDVTRFFNGIAARDINCDCWVCGDHGNWRYFAVLFAHSPICRFCDQCADLQRLELPY